jgi:hypothetical protein
MGWLQAVLFLATLAIAHGCGIAYVILPIIATHAGQELDEPHTYHLPMNPAPQHMLYEPVFNCSLCQLMLQHVVLPPFGNIFPNASIAGGGSELARHVSHPEWLGRASLLRVDLCW